MAKFCPECAHPIIEQDLPFCPKCGAKLPPSPEKVPSPAEQPARDRQPEKTLPAAGGLPAAQPVPGSSERSFSYSGIFYFVIFSDLLICFLFITTIALTFSRYQPAMTLFLLVMLGFNFFMDCLFLYKKGKTPHTIDSGLCIVKTLAGFLGIFTILAGLYFLIISILMSRAYRKTAAALPTKKAPTGFQKVCRGCGALIPADSSGYCAQCTPENTAGTVPEPLAAGRVTGSPVQAGDASGSNLVPVPDTPPPAISPKTVPVVSGEFPTQVQCRACGNRVWPGERYCSRCLVLLPDYTPKDKAPVNPPPPPVVVSRPTSCPACGNPVKPDDRYCSNCLVLVPAGSPATLPEPGTPQTGPAGAGATPSPQVIRIKKPDPVSLLTFRQKISYYSPYGIALVLMLAGIAVFVFGMGLVSGNRSGHNPTFPFAGLITTAVGSIIFSVGLGLTRAIVIAHDRFRSGLR